LSSRSSQRMRLVFDAEANGLLIPATKIWCIVAIDYDTRERYEFRPTEIVEGLDFLGEADCLIGHNICGYDLPLFGKLHPSFSFSGEIRDTFIISNLTNPDRPGGHSIESYGEEFGREKPEHEDWSRFSPEMLHRCVEDTEINVMAAEKLLPLLEEEY